MTFSVAPLLLKVLEEVVAEVPVAAEAAEAAVLFIFLVTLLQRGR